MGDVETAFRERWADPAKLTRNPVDVASDLLRGEDATPGVLPPQLPDPAPRGRQHIQVLRTYPRRRPRYPFAPAGERSVAHAYDKVIGRAHRLIYVEDQYFWASDVVRCFADALRANPRLRLIAVVPHHPDQDGRFSEPPNLVGRQQAMDEVRAAGGDRVAIYGVENHAGTPVYVHAKVCVVDDVWASVGSDNINLRSWTHDSELSCAVFDDDLDEARPPEHRPRWFRSPAFRPPVAAAAGREHLDRPPGGDGDLLDPDSAFDAFADSAQALQRWHDAGRTGPRPSGRLRPYAAQRLSRSTLAWATPLYRAIYDPDARPRQLRRSHRF